MIKQNNKFVGTSFFGDTIETSAKQLKELFGKWDLGDPYKTNFEWNLILEIPFSIYDWKEGDITETTKVRFHIGARNEEESRLVYNNLKKLI